VRAAFLGIVPNALSSRSHHRAPWVQQDRPGEQAVPPGLTWRLIDTTLGDLLTVATCPMNKRRRKLEQIVRAGSSPQRLVLRAKIVLAAADEMADAGIARQLGCSATVMRTWRRRFTYASG
jgi:hypothetical protein